MNRVGRSKITRAFAKIALAASLAMSATCAVAQDKFPSRPVRILVGFSAGAGTDIIARLIGGELQKMWGQSVVIENKGGAAGIIATQDLAKSAPDGYTLMLTVSSHVTNALYYPSVPFDVLKDFAPVTLITSTPRILLAHPSLPANNLKELIALAKAKPGELTYGSGGPGSTGHLSMEFLNLMAGMKMEHIPYKGGNQALQDTIGGRLSVYFASVPSAKAPLAQKLLKPLGASSLKRIAAYPDIPTISESGVPGFQSDVWYGLIAPAGTPSSILNKIQTDVAQVLKEKRIVDTLALEGAEPIGSTPEEFDAFIKTEYETWTKVFKETGLKGNSPE